MRMKIWKTVSAVALAVTCIGMTAFARPIPSSVATTPVNNTLVSAADKNGKDIKSLIIVETPIPEQYQDVVDNIKTRDGFEKVKADLNLKDVTGASRDSDLIVLDVKESRTIGQVEFPVTLTFSAKGVVEDTKGTILHYDGNAWEVIDTTIGEGTMKGTFDSLSPVAFVVDKTTLKSGTSVGTESPKTGVSVPVMGMAVGLGAIVIATGLKKKEYNR